jgi:hypothetical protein
MPSLVIPERLKLSVLLACFALCLATLFTSSPSGDLPTLRPTTIRYCKSERSDAKACSGNECAAKQKTLERCERTVKKAYSRVNLGGCPFQIQANALCEKEWCGKDSTPTQCREECSQVRSRLASCVDGTVNSYLQKAGFSEVN